MTLVALAVVVGTTTGCGLYGERGFLNRGPMRGSTFIRESDELCRDRFRDLRSDVLLMFTTPPLEDEDYEHGHLREAQEDLERLVEDLETLRGPDDLQLLMDDFITRMSDVERTLDAAYETQEDAETGIADINVVLAGLATLSTAFDDIDPALRAAGFEYCGRPFDPDEENTDG